MDSFFIKKPSPGNGRKTYAIIKRTPEGSNSTISHPTLDLINEQAIAGTITTQYAVSELKDLLRSLRGSDRRAIPHNPENLKILDRFWTEEYTHRRLQDPDSGYNDYRRAVESLGNLSLMQASEAEIQKQIDGRWARYPRKQRRLISKLQIIFKFLNRRVRLHLEQKPHPEVRHLSERELEQVMSAIEVENWRLLYRATFHSGLRMGEMFALEPEHILPSGALNVLWQIDDEGKRRRPKRGKTRKTFISEDGLVFVKAWAALPIAVKEEIRKHHHSEILKKVCRQTFPTRPEKHCTMHDLRHSYAIHLLTKQFPLEWVAKNLGDSLKVAEEYYAGFVATDSEIEAMHLAYSGGKK